jgi:hypothetical protein
MTDGFVEFEVGTLDLRRGLQAVAPHVQPDPQAPDTHRVRVEVNDNGEILLLATDGFTAAVYAASGSNVACVGMDYFDLHPADVVKILAVFKAGKDDDPDSPDSVLRFKVTEKLCTIRDVSGLFEGHELELPATPPGQWPNVAEAFGQALVDLDPAGVGGPQARVWPMQLSGKMLERFGKSARAINAPIVLYRGRGPLIVQCSDTFAGVVNPSTISDEQRDKYQSQRLSWSDSMSHLGAVVTGRRAAADEVDERLAAAIRFTGVRQAVTVKGIRDELGIGKAEADQLLTDLFDLGLIGPAARGKARAALFSPDEVDAVLEAVRLGEPWAPAPDEVGTDPFTPPVEPNEAETDDPAPTHEPVPDDDYFDPGATETVGYPGADDPGDLPTEAPTSPFSEPVVPPDPFKDSDGNVWPTLRDPFGAGGA